MNADLDRMWLLLCDAMDCAHAPDERFTIDRDNAAPGEDALQCFQRAGVVGVAEHWKKNDTVRDVEVCVTSGQTIQYSRGSACTTNNAGHR